MKSEKWKWHWIHVLFTFLLSLCLISLLSSCSVWSFLSERDRERDDDHTQWCNQAQENDTAECDAHAGVTGTPIANKQMLKQYLFVHHCLYLIWQITAIHQLMW